MPFLTIAMPVFNGGDLLKLSVQSILNQTFTDWELILIDDGSSDGAVENFSIHTDPRIKVFVDGENKGLACRLNEAIVLASGTYFARMDHDDICHPDRFSHQITYLGKNTTVDLLGAKCITIDENNQVVGTFPVATTHTEICQRVWVGFYLPHPTWIGKTDWFARNKYLQPAPYCCEDQEFLLRTYTESKFHVLPESLLAYRVRTDIAFKKLARTRFSLVKVQVSYFLSKKQYRNVALSSLVFFARLTTDTVNKIMSKFPYFRSQSGKTIKPNNETNWPTLIQALEIEVSYNETNDLIE